MQVNIYTMSNARGIKRQNTRVGYILSTQTSKGEATRSNFELLENVTANQSELQVLILALKRMNQKSILHIYTESEYIKNAVENWLDSWKSNNWINAKGKPVINKKEWQELDKLLAGHAYMFHVKEEHAYRKWLKSEVNRKE
ncbi:MAG: hypothetical protein HFJ09_08570 [Lachnospiraceae bacterium]|nr:hypothetical protein [Lachnospiraceae bacterium]